MGLPDSGLRKCLNRKENNEGKFASSSKHHRCRVRTSEFNAKVGGKGTPWFSTFIFTISDCPFLHDTKPCASGCYESCLISKFAICLSFLHFFSIYFFKKPQPEYVAYVGDKT
jgi:hypothetical protein